MKSACKLELENQVLHLFFKKKEKKTLKNGGGVMREAAMPEIGNHCFNAQMVT